jgi:gas vesicle protein GvpL/GvpF
MPGIGAPRLLEVDRDLWLVVASVPLPRYGEAAINRKLSDLEWVSRAAVSHEAVIESFINATAILPMKLFTIFTSDERALEHVRRDRRRINALAKRVGDHHEWGVRVALDSVPARREARPRRMKKARTPGGFEYLSRKRAERDAAAELTTHAREKVAELYDRLAAQARLAKRRTGSELPVGDGPLLLDAAFLVPRSRSTKFRTLAARQARALTPLGYRIALSGPWPPYTFVQD